MGYGHGSRGGVDTVRDGAFEARPLLRIGSGRPCDAHGTKGRPSFDPLQPCTRLACQNDNRNNNDNNNHNHNHNNKLK